MKNFSDGLDSQSSSVKITGVIIFLFCSVIANSIGGWFFSIFSVVMACIAVIFALSLLFKGKKQQ